MASYATVEEARAQGVPDTYTDEVIQAALDLYTAFIDRACRQWFEPREDITVDLDGNDSPILFLPVPVIALDALYINSDFDNAVDATKYKIYNGRTQLKDDRKNPKIQLVTGQMGIYDSPQWGRGAAFISGAKNQRLVGTFGYTEDDDTTPLLIKRACLKLSIAYLKRSPGEGTMWEELAESVPASNRIISETTDGHTLAYDAYKVTASKPGLNGITGDAEVDRILDLYRGPPVVSATGSLTYFKG